MNVQENMTFGFVKLLLSKILKSQCEYSCTEKKKQTFAEKQMAQSKQSHFVKRYLRRVTLQDLKNFLYIGYLPASLEDNLYIFIV